MLLSLGLLCARTVHAKEANFSALFAEKDQSVWSAGKALVIDTGAVRVGPDPISLGKKVGGIEGDCPFCAGAEAGGVLNADIGLIYGLKLNTGSVDVSYPVNVRLTSPNSASTRAGDAFTIGSSFTVPGLNSGGGASVLQPFLQTSLGTTTAKMVVHGPDLQAFIDLRADLEEFVGAHVCVGGACEGPALPDLNVHESRNLVALNRNDDRLLRVLDNVTPLKVDFSALDGNVTGRLNIPNLSAVSSVKSGSTAASLMTSKRDNIAVLDVNIANIAAKAFGIPLQGTYGPIGYNALDVNAGLALDVKQTLTLVTRPLVTLDFTSPVQQLLRDGSWSAFTKELSFDLGSDITLRNGSGLNNLGIIPTLSLQDTLKSVTSLVIQGNVNVKALAANAFGLNIGPLLDTGDVYSPPLEIPLYSPDPFRVNFDPVIGKPFNVDEIVGLSALRDASETLLDQAGRGPGSADRILSFTECTIAYQRVNNGQCPPGVFIGNTSARIDDVNGNPVYFDSLAGFDLANVLESADSTDSGNAAALASFGYVASARSFVVPQGADAPNFNVVEPGRLGLLLLAGAFLARGASRQRFAPV